MGRLPKGGRPIRNGDDMAKVKYNGEFPADRDHIIHHEIRFDRDAVVNVDDEEILAKLRANRFFAVSDEVSAVDHMAVVKRSPGRPKKEV